MASEFVYKLTDKAEADLDGIVSYISVQLANRQAAADFLDKLQAAINEACAFPESGVPAENEFLPYKAIRKKTISSYIMYYFPDMQAETIYILRIIYGRRNLDEILREMSLS